MYGVAPGVKIHSIHHRQPSSGLSSTTSSSASVTTEAGSTAALLHSARHKKANKKKHLQHFKHDKTHLSRPKELNSLLHPSAVPAIFDNVKKKKDRLKKVSTDSQQQFFGDTESDDGGSCDSIVALPTKLVAESSNYLPVVSAYFNIDGRAFPQKQSVKTSLIRCSTNLTFTRAFLPNFRSAARFYNKN